MSIATQQVKTFKPTTHGGNFYPVLRDSESKAYKRHTNGNEIILVFKDESIAVFNNRFHTIEEYREVH